MTTVHFTCTDCAQTIEVNDAMRETILDAGCPVCTAAAGNPDGRRPLTHRIRLLWLFASTATTTGR